MAAIVSVTNGVTQEDAVHFNQFRDAFSNVLGITETGQDSLGRLVLPRGTSMPGVPSTGMVFYKTDETLNGLDTGVASKGVQFIRTPNGVWIPQNGIRQIVNVVGTAVYNVTVSDTEFLTAHIETSGGGLLIMANTPIYAFRDNTNGLSQPWIQVYLRLVGVNFGSEGIDGHQVFGPREINNYVADQASFVQYIDAPPDEYDVSLRAFKDTYDGGDGGADWTFAQVRHVLGLGNTGTHEATAQITLIELG